MRKESQFRKYGIMLSYVVTVCLMIACSLLNTSPAAGQSGRSGAQSILGKIGVTRGICVVLGDDACQRAIDLALNSELLLYLQVPGMENAEKCRRTVDQAGLYGTRIFIGQGDVTKIHLADNLSDALVVTGNSVSVPETEALRILRPEGIALIQGRKITKPFPDGVDDWSHPYHGPDNNPQSNDRLVYAPYLTQFMAEPHYAPLPQVTVSSAGRVFRATGHIAFKPREEPHANKLTAYNGYNGTILWQRDLVPGIMIHRNTMVATPEILYVSDDNSCKAIDAVTGELIDEITPSLGSGNTFWKWMALEDDVLYALIGEKEITDPEVRNSWYDHGWPWKPLSRGFNSEENPWGFGRNLVAINPKTKKVLWKYTEDKTVDSRAICMKNGRMFLFRFGSYLTCLDTKSGKVLWKRTSEKDPDVFEALGMNLNRQDWQTNFRTESYLKCSDKALYFAGPMMDKLIVLSTDDGSVMWHHPYDNFQIVLRGDELYGISGPWSVSDSKRFNALTGEVLGEFSIGRRACARPTGSADAIFFRANGGSVRLDLASQRQQYVSPMRPDCFDGVTIANGLLYWWPSTCDCQLTLYGVTCLGPAGNHDFYAPAAVADRLEKSPASSRAASFPISEADWPTFRSNNRCTAKSEAVIPNVVSQLWQHTAKSNCTPTAPVTAGGLVFFCDSRGVVYAKDAFSGETMWTAYTGGGINAAPTLWKGRVYIGAGDGWVYALEATTGRRLWRFRAAPGERMIPVYGSIKSTWPVASGVVVDDGIAYAAAGISNYDNTHVFALDAETGKIKWQNNSSGHLNKEARTGIGVQGQLLVNNGKLYMAGGNAVSPAVYDLADGRCLNNGDSLNICESICLRGWELYLVGDKVTAGGQPLYRDREFPVVDETVSEKLLHVSTGECDILWLDGKELRCHNPIAKKILNDSVMKRRYPGWYKIPTWGKLNITEEPIWRRDCDGSIAVAVCKNAVVVVREHEVAAVNIKDGKTIWRRPIPVEPVPWGLAVDRDGRVIVSLKDGRVVCFGATG
ncbi:PQQ-binding-like beta-propeller repeat protein [Candidatus Omnitrophota bacterium]